MASVKVALYVPQAVWGRYRDLAGYVNLTPNKLAARVLEWLAFLTDRDFLFLLRSFEGVRRMAQGRYGRDLLVTALGETLATLKNAILDLETDDEVIDRIDELLTRLRRGKQLSVRSLEEAYYD